MSLTSEELVAALNAALDRLSLVDFVQAIYGWPDDAATD